VKTYTNQKYGFTKKYRDNLNQMDKTLNKTQSYKANEINNMYNNEINKLTQQKQDALQTGNLKSEVAMEQPKQITDSNSTMNRTIAQNTFKGLGGKLSETSNTALLNSAQNVSSQALGTTATIMQEIDDDMTKAKATRDVNLAEASKQKFDLIYDNFYKINEMYIANRELLQDIEEG